LNKLAKNEPILTIFAVYNPEEISHQKIRNSPHLTSTMLPHYLVKNNSSGAACRIVDNIHDTSTGSCQSHPGQRHPLITREDYYKFD